MHLCIGQAYALSVFNLPMTKLIGITHSAPGDWKLTDLGWIFSISIFFLGASAAAFGRWVEEGGPRRAMFTAGLCWGGGFLVSAFGVYSPPTLADLFGIWRAGRIGLGLGYISPVSTLIKWFPDRPGMATGMAIMGFGGGAFIASPLSIWLMRNSPRRRHVGVCRDLHRAWVWSIFIFMRVGAAIVRVPRAGLEAGRLDGAGRRAEADHHEQRPCLRCDQDAAVLADLVGALPERDRRDRRARASLRR